MPRNMGCNLTEITCPQCLQRKTISTGVAGVVGVAVAVADCVALGVDPLTGEPT